MRLAQCIGAGLGLEPFSLKFSASTESLGGIKACSFHQALLRVSTSMTQSDPPINLVEQEGQVVFSEFCR